MIPNVFTESVFQLDEYPVLATKIVATSKNKNLKELTY